MNVDYLLLCDHAMMGEGGKPALVGVFNMINVPRFPAAQRCHIACRLEGTRTEVGGHTMSIRWIGPGEEGSEREHVTIDSTFELKEPPAGRLRSAYHLRVAAEGGLPMLAAGDHRLELRVDGRLERTQHVEVVAVQPPKEQLPEGEGHGGEA